MRSLITTLTAGLVVAGTLGLSTTGAAAYQPSPMPIPGEHYLFDKDHKGDFDKKPGKGWDNRPGIHPYKGGFFFNIFYSINIDAFPLFCGYGTGIFLPADVHRPANEGGQPTTAARGVGAICR